MEFQIYNRFTGVVQFTAEIDCAEDAPFSVKLGLAVKWGIREGANLRGANLMGADLGGANLRGADLMGAYLMGAYLKGAYLGGAYLKGANLRGANLMGADLGGANLGGANLRGADLMGAYLKGAYLGGAYLKGANLGEGCIYVDGGMDFRGYHFFALGSIDDLTVRAGCRHWTNFDAARAHYGENYKSDGDVAECLARLGLIEAQFNARFSPAE